MVVRRLLFFLVLSHGVVFSKTNPLSKISVKSARAFTTPLKRDPGFHLVRYEQDVEVDLADKTKLTGEILEVVVSRKAAAASDAKKDKQKLASSTQQVKSVVLKGNVKITRANHIVKADKAELLVDKKQCIAQGNVHIAQTRKSTADMPVMIDSEKAVLDLSTEQLLLVGTDKAPVSTTFELKISSGIKAKAEKNKNQEKKIIKF